MTDTPADGDGAERATNDVGRAALGTGLGAVLATTSASARQGNGTQRDADGTNGTSTGEDELQTDPTAQYPYEALMLYHEFRKGMVFEVLSPPLPDAPGVAALPSLGGYEVRLISYLNATDELYLFVDPGVGLAEGELYVTGDQYTPLEAGSAGPQVVEVPFRPLRESETPLDLGPGADVPLLDGGGEAAVRPANFHAGALFRIDAGPHGWLPEDVRQSGWFTDYQSYTARYLGVDDRFLFYPQVDAAVQTDQLYVMFDEFELFGPAGNLVAAEFSPVDEGSVPIDRSFLRED